LHRAPCGALLRLPRLLILFLIAVLAVIGALVLPAVLPAILRRAVVLAVAGCSVAGFPVAAVVPLLPRVAIALGCGVRGGIIAAPAILRGGLLAAVTLFGRRRLGLGQGRGVGAHAPEIHEEVGPLFRVAHAGECHGRAGYSLARRGEEGVETLIGPRS